MGKLSRESKQTSRQRGNLAKDTHSCRPLEVSKLFGSSRAVVLEVEPFEEAAVEVAMLKTQCLATLSSITGKQLK